MGKIDTSLLIQLSGRKNQEIFHQMKNRMPHRNLTTMRKTLFDAHENNWLNRKELTKYWVELETLVNDEPKLQALMDKITAEIARREKANEKSFDETLTAMKHVVGRWFSQTFSV